MTSKEIISKLPYSKPFLFVDVITQVDENGIQGQFTFNPNLDFYKGHFKDNPVTPGVILLEVMAQIGLVSYGIYLLNTTVSLPITIALTSSNIDFLKPVFPNEKVTVRSEKIYFRFNKLKCKVEMKNSIGEVVCKGEIAGMMVAH